MLVRKNQFCETEIHVKSVESFVFVSFLVSKVSFLSSKVYKTKFVHASVTERWSLLANDLTVYICHLQVAVKLIENKINITLNCLRLKFWYIYTYAWMKMSKYHQVWDKFHSNIYMDYIMILSALDLYQYMYLYLGCIKLYEKTSFIV